MYTLKLRSFTPASLEFWGIMMLSSYPFLLPFRLTPNDYLISQLAALGPSTIVIICVHAI